MRCDKDYRLSFTGEAEKIIKELTLEEKVKIMSGVGYYFGESYETAGYGNIHYNYRPFYCGGIEDKNIPRMLLCDGSRGVVLGSFLNTCFPVAMLRGAAFDTELEERIGQAIGREVKAWECNLFAGVCINLPYHPGWGRSQETYGEDSFHIGQMAAALIKGVQGENVIACIKHYAFNSMEKSRYKVNITCSKRAEREVFLRHFKECIDAGAAAVMTAYNRFKGEYCGQSDYLIHQVLKKEWEFDGFVMSDFNAGIRDTVTAANSGMDMEMCNTRYYGDKLIKVVLEGKVPEENINEAVLRIIRTLRAFTKDDDRKYNRSVLGCREHIELALEAARKGITLVNNDKGALPFHKEKSARIVVFGKLADQENTGDHGSSRVYPKYVVTPLQGIARVCKKAEVIFYQGSDLDHAVRLAKNADYTIFIVGNDHYDEGEHIEGEDASEYVISRDGDRVTSLGLKREEIELIRAAGAVSKKSAAVLIGGNMILIEEWKNYVDAILMAFYPGMEGGTAIAEILFGEINPSGKLPFVLVKREEDLPRVNWDTSSQTYDYYHGYAKLEKEGKEASIPFGFGLSYTTFQISKAQFTVEDNVIRASCLVENTGTRAGDEIIQFYAGYKNSAVDRPLKELKGFTRVTLAAGECKSVVIRTPVEKLCWYNDVVNRWELEPMGYEMYIGSSSDEKDLIKGSITL